AAGKNFDEALGWTVVADPATGVRLGLPAKMVPVTRDLQNGTRWSSRHGDVQVETFRIKTAEPVNALFEAQKREPANRRPEYSLLKGDTFFISGLQGLKKFSLRAQLKDGELRGVAVLYDQAIEGIVAPVAVAMTTTFAPFPETTAPFATLSKNVEYGTGIVVSADGHFITDRKVTDNCQVIVVSGIGNAERVATDDASGIALLRVYGKTNLTPAPLSSNDVKTGDLTLLGVADPNLQDGDRKVTEMKGKLAETTAIELRQSAPVAGYSGAAAVDGQGRIVGMMQTRSFVLASAGPVAPPVRLLNAATIRDFLTAHGVATTGAANASANAKASIVRIICVR
ncbi:MAG: trypsin-like peptidase domain-containing protein, partial [Pseudolabrys sp.]|nr:trypsin-like peptidase domain-containing protein [Pseudolabrys sp.]